MSSRSHRARRRARFLALGTALSTALVALTAPRVGFAYDDDEDPGAPPIVTPTAPSSFAGMFGAQGFALSAKSPDVRVRVATMGRAAEIGAAMPPGVSRDEIWKIVENGTADVSDDPDASLLVRIAAARALASDPRKDPISSRKALDTLLRSPTPPTKTAPTPPWSGSWGPTTGPWGGPTPGPWGGPFPPVPAPTAPKAPKLANAELLRAARDAAAMSLGALGDYDALLARARSREDLEAHRAAVSALIAFPPPSLLALLPKNETGVPRDIVEVLAKLGDLRGADMLVRAANGKDDSAAALAMVALAHLGDGRVAAIAKSVGGEHTELRVAAAAALAELGEPGADAGIAALLSDEKTAAEGKRLALRYPSALLVAPLEKLAREGSDAAVGALGRVGVPGVASLVALAKDDNALVCDTAAHQLAISPSSAAEDGLASIALTPAAKRRMVRAGAVRAARVGAIPSAIKSAAKELAGSSDGADRSAAFLLLSVLDLGDAASSLASADLPRKRAAATALRAHPRIAAAAVARKHLVDHPGEDDAIVRVLAGVAARAVDGSIARDVPVATTTLATWLAEDGNAAPLAAFLLAARGGGAAQPHVTRALAADSIAVRAGALLGLGASADRHATGELAARLRDFGPVVLRRAAARALVARGDPAAKSALDGARRLDPDAEVRAIASTAKTTTTITPSAPLLSGSEVVQSRVALPKGTVVAATTTAADGLALPALVDAGFLFVFRAPPGPVVVSVAPTAPAPPAPLAAPAPSAKPAGP